MRKVDEWVGRTDDSMPPGSVYMRLWRAQKGRCPQCTRELTAGNVTREHVVPLWLGGENREKNIQLWCTVPCSRSKTSVEAKVKAKADRQFKKRMGFASASDARKPVVPGSKRSRWKKQYNRETGRFETVER